MAQVDPNRIINKLALRLAQKEIDSVVAEILIEDLNAHSARDFEPSADYAPADVSAQGED
ncbi:hypothetical protein SEA_PUREGLOBE5_45 [Arthrobacter phage Pureglobe5]|nr:hypothetical protein PBI_BEAGLE_45 [Arthrobacter phage Beagle]QOP66795.1 hypothetical protein SEA_ODYSSEY395_46 [Arthrobacter phage Odyssey395]UYL87408.1 hypothetical protein SEA_PUREGLOBE5_45 [Arthrobacter phage Pureglobe5]